MLRPSVTLPICLLALVIGTTPTFAATMETGPVFGPETYVRTTGQSNTFQETFNARPGRFELHILNGDEEDNRVSSATIVLNGRTVVDPSQFNQNVERIETPVDLLDANILDITIAGKPGSYITLVIGKNRTNCHMHAGRLILPWGVAAGGPGAGPDLSLALKNGSPVGARRVRIAYLNPDGSLHAVSAPVTMAPRSSFSLDVETDPAAIGWGAGSIEIFWAGPKAGRVLGYASVSDAGCSSQMAPLAYGGHRHHRP